MNFSKRYSVLLLLFPLSLFAQGPNEEKVSQEDCDKGTALINVEKYSEAIVMLNRCLTLNLTEEGVSYFLNARALALSGNGNYKLAIKDQLESIAAFPPADVWPYVMLGSYYRESKEFNKAVEALETAQKYDENGPGTGPGMAVFYHLGWTYFEVGDFAAAIDAFSKGISKQPDYGFALYRRGLAYEQLNNKELARQDFIEAKKLIPSEWLDEKTIKKFEDYNLK